MMRVTSLYLTLAVLFGRIAVAGQSSPASGIDAFNRGEYSVAVSQLQGAQDERGRTFYGLSLAGAGKCKDALPVLASNPPQNGTLRRLAELAAVKCYHNLDQTASASKLLDQLQREFPSDPDVLYLAAKLHIKAFNDATLAMFQKAPDS